MNQPKSWLFAIGLAALAAFYLLSTLLDLESRSPAMAISRSFPTVADTTVGNGHGQNKTGVLRVDAHPERRAYLRFDVEGVQFPVKTASLSLFNASSSTGGYSVWFVSNNTWPEDGMTLASAPSLPTLPVGASGPVSAGARTLIDVTPLVRANGLYSFALTTTAPDGSTVDSRESGAATAPQLIIETLPPTPTRTPTPTTVPNVSTATKTPLNGITAF